MKYDMEKIKQRIDELFDEAVAFRRELHMHPELSEKEEETAKKIHQHLADLGIAYQPNVAGHGVIATVYGKNRQHAVGIRADIDALPITEAVDVDFASQNPGVMHACGHDMHTAIMLYTARILNEMRDELPGSVKFFFQPSEETIGGAEQMIKEGALKNPDVNSVIGLHVETTVPAGSIEFVLGPMNAASTEFYVTVYGQSCHGASPFKGVDPLLPACAMVSSIQSIVTRRIDPTEAALVTIGQFHSGTKNNIIPAETRFSGIIRVLDMKNRYFIKEELERICKQTAASFGAECKVEFVDSYPSLTNDTQLTEWVKESAEEALGKDKIRIRTRASLGADDFSYFCHDSRALYYNLGTARDGEEITAPIHNENFNPDEEAIRTGILSEITAVLRILEEESKDW